LYGVLGEDDSDVETLKVLIRRLAKQDRLPVRGKGFDGGAKLLRKGASALRTLSSLGCKRFVVCHDADGHDPSERLQSVREEIIKRAEVPGESCIVIPVQELEAWILADVAAVTNIFTGWTPGSVSNPEGIAKAKEYLEKLSRAGLSRPRYSHATHNARVADYLDLGIVHQKCPSFRPLAAFVGS
jgi:hypothetical protein